MKLLMHMGIFTLKILYFIFKLFPTKNKIVFISKQTNTLPMDFYMLKEEIAKKSNYKIVIITRRMEKNIGNIIKNLDVIFKEMYHLATSKICITDGYNIPISVLNHKKSLKIFQIWHSLGAIKKFGYQSLDSNEKKSAAKIMKMHKNYDYILCGSEAMKKYFAMAFNYPEDKLYSLGLPRIDYIKNSVKINKQKIYKKYREFKNKKVILYVPTFRENNIYKIDELISKIDLNKYALIIKIHPNMKCEIDENKKIYTCKEFSSLELLSISDYVITDYSAISIEASILEKPIYLYCYDYKEYSKNPGINIDLKKELPGYVFEDINKLYKKLSTEKYDKEIVKKFQDKYICSTNGDVTAKIANFILERGGAIDKKD